jgi:hypothetical protein
MLSGRLQTDTLVSRGQGRGRGQRVSGRVGRKIRKIGEMPRFAPNDLVNQWVGFAGWAGYFGMARLLQVVDEAEEVVADGPEFVDGAVGDTEEFDGIVIQSSFDGPIPDGADLNDAFRSFKPDGCGGIGKGVGGDAEQDDLRGIVLIVVEAGFEARCGVVFPVC